MKPIPTIAELREAISNDLNSRLNLQQNPLKRVLNAFVIVFSGLFRLAYNYLFDIQNNVFPDTADSEAVGGTLERQGRIYLGRNPFPASSGVFTFSTIGISGSVLRAGLTFKSNDDSKNPGQLYITDEEYILGTSDDMQFRSLGGGAEFDLDIGDNLTITEPVIGVNQTVTVVSVTTQPKAAESLEVYRQLILDARQLEPQGGAKTDYRLWAADAQGVRKVYPYVRNGAAGVVDVYVEATTIDSIDGNGTPSAGLLTEVEAVLEFDPDVTKPLNERGRRPIQAIVEAQPVTPIPVSITITGLDDSSTDVRDAIFANVKNYLYDIRPYIASADLPRNKKDILYLFGVQGAVADTLTDGNFFTDFDMLVDGVSENSYQFSLGNIPYLSTITYS